MDSSTFFLTESFLSYFVPLSIAANGCTVETPNKGHFGANSFVPCREVVPISEVK